MFNPHIEKIPETYYGRRSFEIIKEKRLKNILVIYSKSLEKNEELDKLKDFLKEGIVEWIVPKENTLEEITKIARQSKKPEVIIAIGGGNVLDFSKLLRIKLDNPNIDLSQITNSTLLNKKIELIAIPSTPSTGSQVTPIAITHNEEKNEKIIIVNEAGIPDLVILSPQLLNTLSEKQMAEFICDIFAHSVESFLSRITNPFVQILAEGNLRDLIINWKEYLEKGNNLEVLEKLAWNGQIGGICQGNAYTGVMHAMAHQLEMMNGVSHSKVLLNIIKPTLEWYAINLKQKIYKKFTKSFDELKTERYNENIFKEVNEEELIKRILKDPSIKTSPIIFNEEKARDLVKWIIKEK